MGQSLRLVECFHLTMEIHRPRLHSSPSPPFVAIASAQWILPSRLDLLWLASLELLPPPLGACGGTFVASSVGRQACNPNVAPRCCAWPLGREHDAAPRRQGLWTVASLPQPWLRRRCRRHDLLPRFTASSPVSSFLLPCLCALVLVAWPVSQTCLPSAAAPCLSM
jgi:hypothetical protein